MGTLAFPTPAHDRGRHAVVDQPTSGPTESAHASVQLRYIESSPVLVQGPATGRQYQFSGHAPVQSVDVRDADVLLRSRFFRRTSSMR